MLLDQDVEYRGVEHDFRREDGQPFASLGGLFRLVTRFYHGECLFDIFQAGVLPNQYPFILVVGEFLMKY